jgi:OOP family OmpA-OmpF porin
MDQALKSYFADLKYYISQVPNAEIEVSGHTDNVGSLGGNTRLSKKRATEIKGYMERQGVSASNITSVVGEGPNKPLATNDTDEGKAKNRRVEIIVIK